MPDRLVLLPGGRVYLVELKTDTGEVRPAQKVWHDKAATRGTLVVILRGLAEVFCSLDPAYRSHSKVKVGVAGLPKRVILRSVGDYGAWGTDRLRDVLNALAAYQRLPLVTWPELRALLDDGEACLAGKEVRPGYGEPFRTVARGVRLRRR